MLNTLYAVHVCVHIFIPMNANAPQSTTTSTHTLFCLLELPCGQNYCQLRDACHEIFTIP